LLRGGSTSRRGVAAVSGPIPAFVVTVVRGLAAGRLPESEQRQPEHDLYVRHVEDTRPQRTDAHVHEINHGTVPQHSIDQVTDTPRSQQRRTDGLSMR